MSEKKSDALDCRVNGRVPDHATTDEAKTLVVRSYNDETEIPDSVAVTIASWWQSSGSVGNVLAQLASTGRVNVQELLDDITATRRDAGLPTSHLNSDALALDMLATWAINHPSRVQPTHLFEIVPDGDPFGPDTDDGEPAVWRVREYESSYEERYVVAREDISPLYGSADDVQAQLRLTFSGCKVRVAD